MLTLFCLNQFIYTVICRHKEIAKFSKISDRYVSNQCICIQLIKKKKTSLNLATRKVSNKANVFINTCIQLIIIQVYKRKAYFDVTLILKDETLFLQTIMHVFFVTFFYYCVMQLVQKCKATRKD